MKPHSDMKLVDYVRAIVPTLKPGVRKYHLRELCQAVERFCEWLEDDGMLVGDVTPELLAEFKAAAKPAYLVDRLKGVMRTFDPVHFRVRRASKKRVEMDRGNGSEFMLVNLYLDQYEPLALRTRRPNTKRLYKTTLRTFDKFLERSATLDDLNDDAVSRYAEWRGRHVHARSVNKDLFNLLALWRWCNRKGIVDTWPDVQLEKPPKRTPVAWTEAQIRQLYETMSNLPGYVGRHAARHWWPALLLVAWDSGERIAAIMALTWESVDLDSRWARFRAEERKGGREDSAVQLSRETITALRKLQDDDGGSVFPWPYSWSYLWQRLGKIQRDAGLPTDAQSKFHRIRRTVASYAEAAGANATAMLRHSKREITVAYLDPRIVKQQQPSDVLFRLPK